MSSTSAADTQKMTRMSRREEFITALGVTCRGDVMALVIAVGYRSGGPGASHRVPSTALPEFR